MLVSQRNKCKLFFIVFVIATFLLISPHYTCALSSNSVDSYVIYSIGLLCEKDGKKRLLKPGTWKKIRLLKDKETYILAEDGYLYSPENCKDVRYYSVAP